MYRRLLGASGLSLALLGCGGDATDLPDLGPLASRPADDRPKVPPLLAARPEPKTAKEAVEKGVEAAKRDDLGTATSLFEQALKIDPDDREALAMLTLAGMGLAEKSPPGKDRDAAYAESARVARRLRAAVKELKPEEGQVVGQALFFEACSLAAAKRDDRAMASLTEAVDAGFATPEALTSVDDLKALRARPEFPKLVERAKLAAKKVAERRDAAMTKAQLPEVEAGLKGFKPFPFTFALPDVDGKTVKLADVKGRVTIVDIWGTWCPPCKLEIPHFIAIRDHYKDRGVEVIGINYERDVKKGQEKEAIASFVKENGVNYPCLVGDDKTREQVPDFDGFPTTLFLDRSGTVRYKHTGYAPYQVIEFIVKALLDEKTASAKAP